MLLGRLGIVCLSYRIYESEALLRIAYLGDLPYNWLQRIYILDTLGMPFDYAALAVGDTISDRKILLCTDSVGRYAAAVRDESGVFDPSDSRSAVPPMAVAAFSLRGVLDDLGIPRGTLHTAQEMSFHGEVSVAETLHCTASIAQNAVRGSLRFIAVVMDVRDGGQSLVMTAKSTIVTPV